jgi:hypothetical protein
VTPQFGDMDVGAYGKALHIAGKAESRISVQPGPAESRKIVVEFPGFSGGLSHDLGRRPQTITWMVTIRAQDLATLREIEDNIKAALTAGEQTMTLSTGRQLPRVTLQRHKPGRGYDPIYGSDHAGWVRREDTLEFISLAS